MTALQTAACVSADTALIAELLDSNADINVRNGIGWTALHYAAKFSTRPAVLALLLQRGARPGVEDIEGYTPRYLYAKRGLKWPG